MTELAPVAIAVLFGLAGALGVWGARGFLARQYQRDRQWFAEQWRRFNPTEPDQQLLVNAYYISALIILLLLLWVLPYAVFVVPLWLLLLYTPRWYFDASWQARRRKIDEQLAAAIATMCNSIRAGLTLVQSMQRLAETAPEPIRTEFAVMSNSYAFGSSLDTVINEAKARLNLPNFNLFASALLLNREMGGDAAETLWRISQSLDKHKQMKATVEAHTSEGRTNIKVLLAAPIFMLLVMASVDAEAVGLLFSTPQGYAVLLIAGTLIGIGVYMAGRITRWQV